MGPILGQFRDQISPRRGRDEPKRVIKSFKELGSYTFKDLNRLYVFGVQRPPKRASRGPRRLPKGPERAPKPSKKEVQK